MIRRFLFATALSAMTLSGALAAGPNRDVRDPGAALGAGAAAHGSFLHRLKPAVRRLAEQYGLRPMLVMALVKNASGFDPAAETPWGAVGLLPLVPGKGGTDPLLDPDESLARGAAYLGRLHGKTFAEVTNDASRNLLTVAAYRAGLDAVVKTFDARGDVAAAVRLVNRMSAHRVWSRLSRGIGKEAADFVSETTLDMRRWSSPVAAQEVDRLMGIGKPERPALAARISPDSAGDALPVPAPAAKAKPEPRKEEPRTAMALERLKKPVLASARRYGLAPSLILAVMKNESAFDPEAESKAGAVGLMQLVPETAGRDALSYLKGLDGTQAKPHADALTDPAANIELGATYLHLLADRHFKDVKNPKTRRLAVIAAYHAGLGTVARALTGGHRMAPLVKRLNALTPEQVRRELMRRLPAMETKSYIINVTRDLPRFADWDDLV